MNLFGKDIRKAKKGDRTKKGLCLFEIVFMHRVSGYQGNERQRFSKIQLYSLKVSEELTLSHRCERVRKLAFTIFSTICFLIYRLPSRSPIGIQKESIELSVSVAQHTLPMRLSLSRVSFDDNDKRQSTAL